MSSWPLGLVLASSVVSSRMASIHQPGLIWPLLYLGVEGVLTVRDPVTGGGRSPGGDIRDSFVTQWVI